MEEYRVEVEGNIEKWYKGDNAVKKITYYNNGKKEYEYHYDDLSKGNKKEIHYYDSGQKKYEKYYKAFQYHREGDKPSFISWFKSGNKETEEYYKDGGIYREEGPAVNMWFDNGQKYIEQYFKDGDVHREDGAADFRWNEEGILVREGYYLYDKNVRKEEVMKSKKTINIGGKEVSEDTIILALKDYFNKL